MCYKKNITRQISTMKYKNIRAEELKNKVGADWFVNRQQKWTRILITQPCFTYSKN